MKTYYAYIRVSTPKQGKGVSLQEQRDAISAYASAHNLIVSEWFEEKETAAEQGRRLFTRMIASLENGVVAGVILHKVDRGARNLTDWARVQRLPDLGVEVHLVHESIDLNSRSGRLSANLQAVLATDYIWNLREEVRKGIDGRLKQGIFPFPAPKGYLDRGQAKPKAIDPVKGPLVRQAFELYASGRYSFRTLRTELYSRGLTTSGGKPISMLGLTTLLRNPFYIGLIRMKRRNELYQGIHEPLIPKSLFDRVQAILDGRTNTRTIKYDFFLRRMLRCMHCGYSLVGELQKEHTYYRCHTSGCITRCIRQEVIEDQLHAAFRNFRFESWELEQLRKEVVVLKSSWSGEKEQHIRGVQLSLASTEDRLRRLTDSYLDQLIDRAAYTERRAALLHERVAINDRIKALTQGTSSPADECSEFLERVSTLWLSYESGFPYEKRELVVLATSNLSVDEKNVVVELRNPFQILVDERKLIIGAPHRDTVRTKTRERQLKTLARKLWKYFLGEAERRKKLEGHSITTDIRQKKAA